MARLISPVRTLPRGPKFYLRFSGEVEAVCSAALGAATGPGEASDTARFPEKREGSGRYPLLVRTLYFFSCSPTSLMVTVRHPLLGLAFG